MNPFMRALPANDFSPFGVHRPHGALRRLLQFTQNAGLHWLGQRAALLVRGVGLRRLRARPVDVTVETLHARMRLYPHNNACEKRLLFTPQLSDREERRFLSLRITPDMNFLDIGAGVGATSLFVALRAGPRAKVLAVEPQPLLFERLVYNLRQNPAATVKALDCAVADAESEVTLFINPYDLAETSMRIVNVEGGGGKIKVSAHSLATLAREEGFHRIDAMKLDVEGAEDLVLEPFLAAEPEKIWPRVLILAYSPGKWDVDLCALLEARGYVRVLRTRVYVMYERTDAEGGPQ
jgi:FkbM family methyltransferase